MSYTSRLCCNTMARDSGSHDAEALAALFQEMAALVRAGVPLERGLLLLGRDLPGNAQALATALGTQLAAGRSLEQAVDDSRPRSPRVFRAAVQAGIRSGRLAEALEGVALATRRMIELRRAVGMSLIYPTIVICLALLMTPLVTRVVSGMAVWQRDGHRPLTALMSRYEFWGPGQFDPWYAIPVLLATVVILFGLISGAGIIEGGWRTELFRCFPWVRQAIDNARRAHFADQLALLVEHEAPFHDALKVAAEGTVDRRLRRDAMSVANAVSSGRRLTDVCAERSVFTPLLNWLIASGAANESLGRSLRHAADMYQSRSLANADLARICLPGLLTSIVGGAVTAALGVLVVWPWTQLLQQIVR